MTELPPFKLLLASGDEPLKRQVLDAAFISLYLKSEQRGLGVVIKTAAINEIHIAQAFREVAKALGHDPREAEVKVIVPKAAQEKLNHFLKAIGLNVVKVVVRIEPKFRIIYQPSTGQLRISSEHFSTPVAKQTKIKVLIVDDSATIRKLLSSILKQSDQFEVETADLPSKVEPLIQSFKPDVVTLDIHMPEMNGVELLKRLLPKYGIPSIMITSVSREEGNFVLEALELGAIDYIQKPTMNELKELGPIILEKIKVAAKSKRRLPKSRRSPKIQTIGEKKFRADAIVAIGSSTGGTEALREILVELPRNFPPVVIVQHIPAGFSEALANRLNRLCQIEVKEAEDGDEVRFGRVLIAPGGKQMRLKKRSGGFIVVVSDDAPVNRHKPSVDVLFDSVAKLVGGKATGIILTGMGADGAKGLLEMRKQNSPTVAQDEATCVVFGMPNEAIKLGAAKDILPLLEISEYLVKSLVD